MISLFASAALCIFGSLPGAFFVGHILNIEACQHDESLAGFFHGSSRSAFRFRLRLMSDQLPQSDDFEPLPSIIDADFEHEKMLDFGLPLRYSDIDWHDETQREGYILFVMWFLEQLIAGDLTADGEPETAESAALRAQLDQLHAEMRENALLAGLNVPESRAPFAELEDEN